MARQKYGNTILNFEGMRFDSKRELDQWIKLRNKEKRGEIRNLRRQISYDFSTKELGQLKYIGSKKRKGVALRYVADFVYDEPNTIVLDPGKMADIGWHTVVEDAKGCLTDSYKIKRALMLWVHGIKIRES